MAVNLVNYVNALRREVSPPGSTAFTSVLDAVFVGYLADAFWEVKLDGFVEPWECSVEGIITPIIGTYSDPLIDPLTTPYNPAVDMPRDQIALIVLYAGIKIIRNRLLESTTRTHAKAGPVEFSQESSANLLTEMLKELSNTRQRLLYLKTYNQDVSLIDAFSGRSASAASYAGYLYDLYAGAFGSNTSDFFDVSNVL